MSVPARQELVGDREIVISRIVDAPRDLVWRAWTDPGQIGKWWGPNGFTSQTAKLDLRPGGSFEILLNGPDGNVYPCRATFREVVEPERIVYVGPTNEPAGCGAGVPPDATVTVTFAEKTSEKTEIMIYTVLASAEHREAARREGFIEGWNDSLDRLTAELQETIQ